MFELTTAAWARAEMGAPRAFRSWLFADPVNGAERTVRKRHHFRHTQIASSPVCR